MRWKTKNRSMRRSPQHSSEVVAHLAARRQCKLVNSWIYLNRFPTETKFATKWACHCKCCSEERRNENRKECEWGARKRLTRQRFACGVYRVGSVGLPLELGHVLLLVCCMHAETRRGQKWAKTQSLLSRRKHALINASCIEKRSEEWDSNWHIGE